MYNNPSFNSFRTSIWSIWSDCIHRPHTIAITLKDKMRKSSILSPYIPQKFNMSYMKLEGVFRFSESIFCIISLWPPPIGLSPPPPPNSYPIPACIFPYCYAYIHFGSIFIDSSIRSWFKGLWKSTHYERRHDAMKTNGMNNPNNYELIWLVQYCFFLFL